MSLRPYQQKIVQALRDSIVRGNKRIALCAPTGAGKTRMFCYMVENHIKKGGKALIVTDRIELLKQAGKAFQNIEEIKAGIEPDLSRNLHCAMLETLFRRLEKDYYKKYLSTRTMVILDEAHKASFDKLFTYFGENTIVIGATATPLRIGKQPSMDMFYTDMVQDVDTPDLIEQGFLANALTYGVDVDLKGVKMKGGDYDASGLAQRYHENKVFEGVIENYNRICPNKKALLFAANIESSQEVCQKLNMAGLPSRHLDSENFTSQERQNVLSWFKETPNAILCNVGILTTGFDEPTIEAVILYRATKSLPLFLQMVGRGSRTIPGLKDKFYILDLGNNVKTHSFWESPRTWSLTKKQRKKKEGPAPVKICPGCRAMLAVSVNICNFCQYEFKKEYGGKNEFAELQLLTPGKKWAEVNKADIATKAKMAKAKVVKPMAILHQLKTKEEGLQFIKEMGYKSSFAYVNRDKFKCFESL